MLQYCPVFGLWSCLRIWVWFVIQIQPPTVGRVKPVNIFLAVESSLSSTAASISGIFPLRPPLVSPANAKPCSLHTTVTLVEWPFSWVLTDVSRCIDARGCHYLFPCVMTGTITVLQVCYCLSVLVKKVIFVCI